LAASTSEVLTFGASINQRLQAVWVFFINQSNQCSINPSPSLNTVQSANDNVELHVEIVVLVLNLTVVWCDINALDSPFHESSSTFGFRFSNIAMAEKELTVKVRDVDGVWIS